MDLFPENSPSRAGSTSPITKSAKLTELRVLCKNFGLSPSGSKKTILNRLYSHGALKPTETTPQKLPQNDTFTKASKKEDLENACRQLNLKTSGNKDDLIRRLKYFKKKLESIKQNEEEMKKASLGGSKTGSSKQYSDYEMLQANALMAGKPFKFPKRNSGSVLQISHSIVDIINVIEKQKDIFNLIEKPKHPFAEGMAEVADMAKASFFGSFSLKPVVHQNTVIQLDETETSEDSDMDDFTDPLADVTEFSNAGLDYDEEKTDVNENITANDVIDPLEVQGFSSAITQVTDTLEKYDLTFLSDSGIDEESNVSDSSSDNSDDDIDVGNLSMIKVIEFVEDAIENIVSVGVGNGGGEVTEDKNEKPQFFAWGSFQNETGSPEKIKFIV